MGFTVPIITAINFIAGAILLYFSNYILVDKIEDDIQTRIDFLKVGEILLAVTGLNFFFVLEAPIAGLFCCGCLYYLYYFLKSLFVGDLGDYRKKVIAKERITGLLLMVNAFITIHFFLLAAKAAHQS